jgi:cell wall-associated NlpC family hydrolase
VLIVFIYAVFLMSCGLPRPSENVNASDRREWDRILEITQKKYPGMDTAKLISHVKFYLGTPYKYGGSNRYGMDCSGFVMSVFKSAFDVDLPHNAEQISNKTKSIPLKNIQCGDLVFFEIVKGNGISHVGIYLTNTHFVHASSKRGVTISSFRKEYYKKRFKAVHRVLQLQFR